MICNFNHARVLHIGRYGNLRRDHDTFLDERHPLEQGIRRRMYQRMRATPGRTSCRQWPQGFRTMGEHGRAEMGGMVQGREERGMRTRGRGKSQLIRTTT